MLALLGIVFVLTGIYHYHRLKVLDQRIESSWRKLDNELLKMEELSSGLIRMVGPHIKKEKKHRMQKARQRMMKTPDPEERLKAAEELAELMESVPELLHNQRYQGLMEMISDAQDKINYLMKYYDDSASFYNQVLATAPEKWIAWAFNQKEKPIIGV